MCPNILFPQTLSTLAAFLAVEESALEAMLTQRVVVTRGETFTKQLSADDANLTRDAIVKSLYEVRALVESSWKVLQLPGRNSSKGPVSCGAERENRSALGRHLDPSRRLRKNHNHRLTFTVSPFVLYRELLLRTCTRGLCLHRLLCRAVALFAC